MYIFLSLKTNVIFFGHGYMPGWFPFDKWHNIKQWNECRKKCLKPFNAFIFLFLKQIFKVIIYCIQSYFCTVFCSHLYSCKHFGPVLNSPRHICMIDTLSYRSNLEFVSKSPGLEFTCWNEGANIKREQRFPVYSNWSHTYKFWISWTLISTEP